MKPINDKNWQALRPDEVKKLFEHLTIPWWIAGGWGIDLFIGEKTREHLDLDILILRKDQFLIKDFLSDWLLYKTNQPGLLLWNNSEFLEIGVNSIWCKKNEQSSWLMEIMLMDSEDDEWFYQREPKIKGLIKKIGYLTETGIPYLRPEIQLLYKAHIKPNEKDEQDFHNVLPLLDKNSLKWLKKSILIQFNEDHKWIKEINETLILK